MLRVSILALLVAAAHGLARQSARMPIRASMAASPKKVVVLGGTGFVGRTVAEMALARGHSVTCLSRRGTPEGKEALAGATYVQGDATDAATVTNVIKDCDAVVHAVGLLFDITTPGGGALNLIVSGSKSRPGEGSTYDAITRVTTFNAVAALSKRPRLNLPFTEAKPPPALCFVSAAEAGWPDVAGGEQVEKIAPDALGRYLVAKRAVEAELTRAGKEGILRPVIYRPSLIWNWSKLDVLPIIPFFNLASALGVPFVDKTVRVETLAAAVVAGLEDDSLSGVQRFAEMEALEKALKSS